MCTPLYAYTAVNREISTHSTYRLRESIHEFIIDGRWVISQSIIPKDKIIWNYIILFNGMTFIIFITADNF